MDEQLLQYFYNSCRQQHERFKMLKTQITKTVVSVTNDTMATSDQIPLSSLHPNVKLHIIDGTSFTTQITYTYAIANIVVHVMLPNNHCKWNDNYVYKYIMPWLGHFCHPRSSNTTVFLYYASHKKVLHTTTSSLQIEPLHVNTGVTIPQLHDQDTKHIVIYRAEEWFKVLLHESLHAFRYDWSTNETACRTTSTCMRRMFGLMSLPVVNLYETYVECWARILYILFCSYYAKVLRTVPRQQQYASFCEQATNLWKREMQFARNQRNKIIRLIQEHKQTESTYTETTNVLAYYVWTADILSAFPNSVSVFIATSWVNKQQLPWQCNPFTTPNQICAIIKNTYLSLRSITSSATTARQRRHPFKLFQSHGSKHSLENNKTMRMTITSISAN